MLESGGTRRAEGNQEQCDLCCRQGCQVGLTALAEGAGASAELWVCPRLALSNPGGQDRVPAPARLGAGSYLTRSSRWQ